MTRPTRERSRHPDWLATLTYLLGHIEAPLVLSDPRGQLLYSSPLLSRTLEEDPERLQVQRAIGAMARALFLQGGATARPKGAEPMTHRIRTALARYELRGSRLAPTLGGRDAIGLIALTRERRRRTLPPALGARYRLTARELQVAQLLLQRRSNAEVASALGISLHTARHHTERVLFKLGVPSRRAAAQKLYDELGGK